MVNTQQGHVAQGGVEPSRHSLHGGEWETIVPRKEESCPEINKNRSQTQRRAAHVNNKR